MSVDFRRDDRRQLIIVTLRGVCTAEEMVATIHRQASEGTWQYATLIDARDCAPPSPADVAEIHQAVQSYRTQLGTRGKAALVVAADSDVAFAMGRMYELRADDERFCVFKDVAEAERWATGQRTAG